MELPALSFSGVQARKIFVDGTSSIDASGRGYRAANGLPGSGFQAGGGSGGTVNIVAPLITGSGEVRADGGGNEVGGGGGRLRLLYDSDLSNLAGLSWSAAGSAGANASGKPGTVRLLTPPAADFPLPEVPALPIAGDVNSDFRIDSIDVQLVVNAVLGVSQRTIVDPSGDGRADAIDVQLVVNALLGL
jgi:hypothetical protein